MRPSIRQLEYLVAVAKTLNFREAAKTCNVTQPALSAQIARLEELLGVTLFERNRRHVLLTPVGEELTQRAQSLLAQVDELSEAAGSFASPFSGVLRLGVIPTIAPYVMPRALKLLKGKFPNLTVLLREEQTGRSLELLREGRLDLLLLALEAELGDVETRAAFKDPFVFAASAEHPLATRKTVRERDMAGERVLLLEDGHCLKDQAWSFCEPRGAQQLADFRATSLGTLAQMVSTGTGVTLLPALSLPVEGKLPGLVVKPFQRPVPFRTVGFAWRSTSPRHELFNTIASELSTLGVEVERFTR